MTQLNAKFINYYIDPVTQPVDAEKRPVEAAVVGMSAEDREIFTALHYLASFWGDAQSLRQFFTLPLEHPTGLLHWAAASTGLASLPSTLPQLPDQYEHLQQVQPLGHLLKDYGARFFCRHHGYTPDYQGVVEAILEAKDETVDQPNDKGFTPLQYAATSCNVPMMQALLEHKADARIVGKDKETVLTKVLTSKAEPAHKLQAVQLLLQHGVEPTTTDLLHAVSAGTEIFQEVLPKTKNPAAANEHGTTPLMRAAELLEVDAVKLLVDSQPESKEGHINTTSAGNSTALHHALVAELSSATFRTQRRKQLEIVRMLLSAGADPNIGYDHVDTTALWCAISNLSHDDPMLLSSMFSGSIRPDVNFQFRDGDTVLIRTIKQGYLESAAYLLKHKTDSSISSDNVACVLALIDQLMTKVVQLRKQEEFSKIFSLLQTIGKSIGIGEKCQQLQELFFSGNFLQFLRALTALSQHLQSQKNSESKDDNSAATTITDLTIDDISTLSQEEFVHSLLFYSHEKTLPSLLAQEKITQEHWDNLKLFMFAVARDLLHVVRYFLDQGATMTQLLHANKKNKFAVFTKLLTRVIEQGNLILFDVLLIQLEKELSATEKAKPYSQMLAVLLQEAVHYGRIDIVKHLIEKKGVRIVADTKEEPEELSADEYALQLGQIDIGDETTAVTRAESDVLLATAIKRGWDELAYYLMQNGAQPLPIHAFLAIEAADSPTWVNFAKYIFRSLVEKGLKLIELRNNDGESLLHCAAQHNRLHLAECLLADEVREEKRPTLESKDSPQGGAVTLTATTSHSTAKEWLLQTDWRGDLALHAAISAGATDVTKYLIQQHTAHRVPFDSPYRKTSDEARNPNATAEIVSALIASEMDLYGAPQNWLAAFIHNKPNKISHLQLAAIMHSLVERYFLNPYERTYNHQSLVVSLARNDDFAILDLVVKHYHQYPRKLYDIVFATLTNFTGALLILVFDYQFQRPANVIPTTNAYQSLVQRWRCTGVTDTKLLRASATANNEATSSDDEGDDEPTYLASAANHGASSDDGYENDEKDHAGVGLYRRRYS